MSTFNNKASPSASGLSRQSERSYKALRKKSNADLDKTLRQLDTEQKASISKMLHEEYALKNVHHALKTAGLFAKRGRFETQPEVDLGSDGGEEIMECDSELLDINANTDNFIGPGDLIYAETKADKVKPHANEAYSCHLPIIVEETSHRPSRAKQPITRGSSYTLPPLTRVDSFTTKPRSFDERSLGSLPPSSRSRIRTQSNPMEPGNLAVDSYSRYGVNTKRKSYMDPIGHRRHSSDSNRDRPDPRTRDDSITNKPVEAWGGGIANCRYLRRSVSSPDVLDPEFFFKN